MASGNETTTKFKVDISELKKGIQDANRQIKLANAEFKAASASMDSWGKSADGLTAKINQTEKVLKAQKAILNDYKKQLTLIEAEYGKNSKEADEMRIKVENQRATVIKTQKSLGDYKNQLSQLQSEQSKSAAAVEKQSSAYDKLKGKISEQEKQLESLKTDYANIVLEQGKNSDSAKSLAGDIERLSTELNENKGKLQEVDKAADDLDKSLDNTSDSAAEASKGGFTVLKGALANLVSDGIELAIQGLKRLGDKIIEVGKQSISNYAEYEQLVGGVETLFGAQGMSLEEYAKSVGKSTSSVKKDYEKMQRAQQTVFDNASKAYKTAGMSANDYMETVTGFSASLIHGLGGDTEKAAKIADLAITDMSDNANKMGTSIESIQNAYQGFAKQNFSMLDNLKLGYGGTQAEMARLINDTGVMGDTFEATAENVKEVSFDKMIEAIHKVQDEMGITGTTSKEAADTIEGSKNSMQASWSNLLTGLADENADLEQLWDTFATSAETYMGNILPRIKTLVGQAVDFAKEKLKEKFPEVYDVLAQIGEMLSGVFDFIVDDVLPTLQQVGGWLADNLLPIIKDIVGWVLDNKDPIIAALVGVGTALVAWNIATVVANVVKMVKAVKAMGAASAFAAAKQWLLNTALLANPIGLIIAAIAGLVAAFVVLWKKSESFRNFWKGLWEGIQKVVSAVVDWISGAFKKIVGFFKNNWKSILLFIINPFAGVFKYLYDHFEGFRNFVNGIWEAIKGFFISAGEKIKAIWNAIVSFFVGIWEAIKSAFSTAIQFIIDTFQAVVDFFVNAWNSIKEFASAAWDFIKGIWNAVADWFNENVIQPVVDFFTGLWDGIKTAASTAWDFIKSIWSAVSGWFNSTIIQPVAKFFTGMWDGLKNGAKSAWEGIKSVFGHVADWFKNIFSKAWQKVKDVFSTGGKIFTGIKDGIVNAFKTVVNAIIRGINKVISIPFNAINAIFDKIRGVSILGYNPFSWIPQFGVPQIPELKQGGVLKRGQVGLLEGDGAEAVVPLENNKRWISATAAQLKNALAAEGIIGGNGGAAGGSPTYTFNQYNTSPKALSRLEIYRQSKNLLHMKGAT